MAIVSEALKENPELKKHGIWVTTDTEEKLDFPKLGNNKSQPFEIFVRSFLNEIGDLLIEKNKSYGNSAIDPIRIFSKADKVEQIKVRIDDKLNRIKQGTDAFNEDTEKDLIGYLILKRYVETL
jgi:hypothetical protein